MITRNSDRPAPLIWSHTTTPARQRRLGRDEIVAAAIEVADDGGVDALTMTAVARKLGTYTAMSLYRYVVSKDGLVDLMLDAAIGEVAVPDQRVPDQRVPDQRASSWRADLHALADSSWAMVKKHLWYAQLVQTRPPLGPNTMRRTEFILGVIVEQGASVSEAMTYAALLDRHIFGSALREAEELAMYRRYGIDNAERLMEEVVAAREVAVARGNYPHLAQWMAVPSDVTADQQFELSLEFLLDGIAGRLQEAGRG
jgi:AcrR family transcriptional regulator